MSSPSTSFVPKTTSGLCTTPLRDDEPALERASSLASWFSVPQVPRRKRSIAALFQEEQVEVVLIADDLVTLYHVDSQDTPVFFHPGMAMPRVRGLRRGERDRMVDAVAFRPGDTVLDATLGLGADSLVAAEAVGPTGHVTGLDASWYLTRLIQFAQKHARTHFPQIHELMQRLAVVYCDHHEYLKGLPDDSVDIIMFDPMFRVPPKYATDLGPARPLTMSGSLTDAAWVQAKRVARRAVVLKERPGFGQFERFGVRPDKPRTRFAYGVWRKDG